MSDIPTPIIGLIIAVFVLVFLVIRTRVHALIAMLAAACIAGERSSAAPATPSKAAVGVKRSSPSWVGSTSRST